MSTVAQNQPHVTDTSSSSKKTPQAYFTISVIIAVFVAITYSMLPSVLEPTVWTEPFPLPSLDGPLAVNTYLQQTAKKGDKGNVLAPESMAIDPEDGTIFASLGSGQVVAVSSNYESVKTVFFSGGFMAQGHSSSTSRTNGISGQEQLQKTCVTEATHHRLAWNTALERRCGRPLGIRLVKDRQQSKNYLYILDAYHGLFRLDINDAKKAAEHIITPKHPITLPTNTGEDVDPAVLFPPRFFNDLDVVTEEGMVFFTDTSYKHTRSENRQELLDGAPRGRLFAFNLNTNTLTVLLCGLHFPNGIQLLNPERRGPLLLAESTRFRILQVDPYRLLSTSPSESLLRSCREHGSLWQHLAAQKGSDSAVASKGGQKGPGQGQPAVSVFLDEAPGFMDNLRADSATKTKKNPEKRLFFVGLGTKSSKPFSLLWFGYQTVMLRDFIGKFVPMRYVEKLVPKYGLVLVINGVGDKLGSLQDPGGRVVSLVSEAQRHPTTGDLVLGSHSNSFLGVLPAEALKAFDSELARRNAG